MNLLQNGLTCGAIIRMEDKEKKKTKKQKNNKNTCNMCFEINKPKYHQNSFCGSKQQLPKAGSLFV